MSTKRETKKQTFRIKIKHRVGGVTLAASNGVVIDVQGNNLGVAIATVLASNMLWEHNRWELWDDMFDVTLEVNTYRKNG